MAIMGLPTWVFRYLLRRRLRYVLTIGLLSAFDPLSQSRLRIFGFKLLILLPFAMLLAVRYRYPVFDEIALCAFWYGLFAEGDSVISLGAGCGSVIEQLGRVAGLFCAQMPRWIPISCRIR